MEGMGRRLLGVIQQKKPSVMQESYWMNFSVKLNIMTVLDGRLGRERVRDMANHSLASLPSVRCTFEDFLLPAVQHPALC